MSSDMPEHKIPRPTNILDSFKPMQMNIMREKYLVFSSFILYINVLEFSLANIVAYVIIDFSHLHFWVNEFVYS